MKKLFSFFVVNLFAIKEVYAHVSMSDIYGDDYLDGADPSAKLIALLIMLLLLPMCWIYGTFFNKKK